MKNKRPQEQLHDRYGRRRSAPRSFSKNFLEYAPIAFGGTLLIAAFAFAGNYMGQNAVAHDQAQEQAQASLVAPTSDILAKGSLLPADDNFDIVNPAAGQTLVQRDAKEDFTDSSLMTEALVVAGGKQAVLLEEVAVVKNKKNNDKSEKVIITPAAVDLTHDNNTAVVVKPIAKRVALAALASKGELPGAAKPSQVAPRQSSRPQVASANLSHSQLAEENCLARAVYFESRSESEKGQLAVAKVILNRTRNPDYPKTICGVVYQGSGSRNSCQFSFACDGMPDDVRQPGAWAHAKMIARKAMSGQDGMEVIGTATNYHADYVRPRWANKMRRLVKIGRHIFYAGG